uniref:Uncharacterized protein n=1 Tax=Anguilla anguilla TaxID=7936 RepID=A0A0E9SXZ1_ANGAN
MFVQDPAEVWMAGYKKCVVFANQLLRPEKPGQGQKRTRK